MEDAQKTKREEPAAGLVEAVCPSKKLDRATVEAQIRQTTGPEYWRSLEELAGTPEFQEMLHREFPKGASEWVESVSRRGFLQLMGASLAMAGMGWYSGNRNDSFLLWNRLHGPYAFFYFLLLLCNIGIPQVLWIRKLRTNTVALFFVSLVILVGMWLERFVIVVMSLHRDFLNSSWGMYYPTRWDWMTYIGTIGMFLAAMFLFVRILPMISIFEMRTLLPEAEVKPE